MKHTKTCPKCVGKDILRIDGTVLPNGAGNNIRTVHLSYVMVNRYLCCDCGYSEEWVSPRDIPQLKEKYAK